MDSEVFTYNKQSNSETIYLNGISQVLTENKETNNLTNSINEISLFVNHDITDIVEEIESIDNQYE